MDRDQAPGRRDRLWAVGTGLAALAVYLCTLAPGLVGTVDTPMFQFVGRVLGVAHNPGYPLYTLLTHPISYLPLGTLGYRINLFSACAAAVAVALTYLAARWLGCGTAISIGAALGLAFGRTFWSQAVIAEVYTLNAALIAAVLVFSLAWLHIRRPMYFFSGVACLALGIGNHTTILAFVPGLAAGALIANRRFAWSLRTVMGSAAIVSAGFLQYGFILLRSRQSGVYLESPASTVGALVQVIRGSQFSDRLFVFGWRTVVFERLPLLVGQVLAAELTIPGLLCALVGALLLVRHRPAAGVLLLSGATIVFGFTLNYAVSDLPVFLIPTILVLWLTLAVALEALAGRLHRHARVAAFGTAAAALLLPAWNLAANFEGNDLSRSVGDQVYFDRLFDALPARAALVREDYLVDRMVNFKLLGEDAARGREIVLAPADAGRLRELGSEGFSIFAFEKSTARLRLDGLDFSYSPYALTGEQLTPFVSHLPDGALVAIAVPALYGAGFERMSTGLFDLLGAPGRTVGGRTQSNLVLVGFRGARRGALDRASMRPLVVDVFPREIESSFKGPDGFQLGANTMEAFIRLGSRDLMRSSQGIALGVWAPDGALMGTYLVGPERDGRVPIPRNPLSLYQFRGEARAISIAEKWTDLSAATGTGVFLLKLSPGSRVTIYLGGDAALAPRVVDQSSSLVSVHTAPIIDESRQTIETDLAASGWDRSTIVRQASLIRIDASLAATADASASAMIALGGLPRLTIGRSAMGSPSGSASLSQVNTDELLRTMDRETETLLMARDEQSMLVGQGWSEVDFDGITPYRWMERPSARLVLPIHFEKPSGITVQAFGTNDRPEAARSLALQVNGVALPVQPMQAGWASYSWEPPPGLLNAGVNELEVQIVGPQFQPRSVAVTTVVVSH